MSVVVFFCLANKNTNTIATAMTIVGIIMFLPMPLYCYMTCIAQRYYDTDYPYVAVLCWHSSVDLTPLTVLLRPLG